MKVAIVQTIHPVGIHLLRSQKIEIHEIPSPSKEIIDRQVADADAIIVRTFPISGDLIRRCKRLRVIGRYGVGVDNVDIDAATEYRIPVVYAPVANTKTVAEHTLALVLALAKQLLYADRAFRKGEWTIRENHLSVDLEGKTLGLIGFGRIGSEAARKAISGFCMKVLAYDPLIADKPSTMDHVRFADSLEALLKESDFVSIHVPSTKQTEHMIGERELQMMRPDSFLINTSRGNIVDEKALVLALREGRLAGAGLDVFEKEPPDPGHSFFGLNNVIVTPHMAGMTKESVARISTTVAQGVLDVLQGRRPQYVYNPGVYKG